MTLAQASLRPVGLALPQPPLLVISDRRQMRLPVEAWAEAVFRGGCRWLSLREKDLEPAARLALLRRLVETGRRYGAAVTLHGDPAEALAAEAAGVHLPGGGSPRAARRLLGAAALIGVSAHARAEAEAAAHAGAGYVSLSPVFPSASKPNYGPPLGLAGLRAAAGGLAVPVVALGGVTEANAAGCLAAGAAAVAVMGPVARAADPAAATARLLAALARR